MERSFESLVACFACEVRLAIFQELVEDGPMTMGALAEEIGVAPSTLTAHVAMLRELGIVEVRRDGREMIVDALVGGVELVLLPHPRAARAAGHDGQSAAER